MSAASILCACVFGILVSEVIRRLRSGPKSTEHVSPTMDDIQHRGPLLHPLVDDKDSLIDIIAVQGLGAYYPGTWEGKNPAGDRRMWLEHPDFLPKDFPNARIAVFIYDSRWLFDANFQHPRDFSEHLLHALVEDRRKKCIAARPIIFIGHSMGGIVIKSALLSAVNSDKSEYRKIAQDTKGIIFLGTPHKGSSWAMPAHLFAKIYRPLGGSYLHSLQLLMTERELMEIDEKLWPKMRNSNLNPTLVCFYETQGFPWLGILDPGPLVLRYSARLDHADTEGMRCTHTMLNKFGCPKDPRYQALVRRLKAMEQSVADPYSCQMVQASNEVMLTRILDTLGPNNTEKAKHQEQHKVDCHPKTRESLLRDIYQWFSPPAPHNHSTSNRLWWITGPPAMGKSAVAITVAKRLEPGQRDIPKPSVDGPLLVLGAQYFVNHNLDSSNPHKIFPTIAAQLAKLDHYACVSLYDAITPMIKHGTAYKLLELSEYQADLLFVRPLKAICESTECKNRVLVIVLDGIDELRVNKDLDAATSDPVHDFTKIFCTISAKLPQNARVLVLSRPERSICKCLRSSSSSIRTSSFPTAELKKDVDTFLRTNIRKMVESADYCQDWPSEDQIDIIRNTAEGHVAIAKAAILLIQTTFRDQGMPRANKMFEMIKNVKTGNLYHFYEKLLRDVILETTPPLDQEGCTFVLACISVAQDKTIGTISALFKAKYPKNDEFDVYHFFSSIRSIAIRNINPIHDKTIPSPHKSLVDYLTSEEPPEAFRVDAGHWRNELAELCFAIMQQSLHFNMGEITTSLSCLSFDEFKQTEILSKKPRLFKYTADQPISVDLSVAYACDTFHVHLGQATLGDKRTLEMVNILVKELLLFWMEAISLARYHGMIMKATEPSPALASKAAEFHPMLPALSLLVKRKDRSLEDFIRGAITFTTECYNIVSQSIPHLYISALPFFAPKLHVAAHYHARYPHTLSLKTISSMTSGMHVKPSSSSTADFKLLNIRDDILVLVSVLSHWVVAGWRSGDWHHGVACASNGSRLVIHWKQSKSLEIWDVNSQQKQAEIAHLGGYDEIYLQFLNDNIRVAVGFEATGTVSIFDCQQHTWVAAIDSNQRGFYSSLSTSPVNGKLLWRPHCGKGTTHIHVVDITGERPRSQHYTYNSPPNTWHSEFRVFEDGRHFVIGVDERLVIGNLNSVSTKGRALSPIESLAISPNEKFIIAISANCTIYVWDVEGQGIATLPGHELDRHRFGMQFSFFPDGKHFVLSVPTSSNSSYVPTKSKDSPLDVRLWDIASLVDKSVKLGRMDTWESVPLECVQSTSDRPGSSGWPTFAGNWVVDTSTEKGDILFWQPRYHRFYNERNVLCIGGQEYYELDLTHFVHGKDWVKCRLPLEEPHIIHAEDEEQSTSLAMVEEENLVQKMESSTWLS